MGRIIREKTAKWLASVIENGEPYDDDYLGSHSLRDLVPEPIEPEAFLELADKFLKYIGWPPN